MNIILTLIIAGLLAYIAIDTDRQEAKNRKVQKKRSENSKKTLDRI